jgi:UDP-2,3-diacylglucosamine pyrophosphatase LpxH
MRTIVIADAHIGSPEANVPSFCAFLQHIELQRPDKVILLGDTFDLWQMQKSDILSRYKSLVAKLNNLPGVIYVLGNHDANYLSPPLLSLYTTIALDVDMLVGEDRTVLVHGHQFDTAYRKLTQKMDDWANCNLRRLVNWSYKDILDRMAKYDANIGNLREQSVREFSKMGYKNVIVGHTHWPEDVMVGEVRFVNVGDWKVHNSYVEIVDGEITLKYFKE